MWLTRRTSRCCPTPRSSCIASIPRGRHAAGSDEFRSFSFSVTEIAPTSASVPEAAQAQTWRCHHSRRCSADRGAAACTRARACTCLRPRPRPRLVPRRHPDPHRRLRLAGTPPTEATPPRADDEVQVATQAQTTIIAEAGVDLTKAADLGRGSPVRGSATDVFRARSSVANLAQPSADVDGDYFQLSIFDYLVRRLTRRGR